MGWNARADYGRARAGEKIRDGGALPAPPLPKKAPKESADRNRYAATLMSPAALSTTTWVSKYTISGAPVATRAMLSRHGPL